MGKSFTRLSNDVFREPTRFDYTNLVRQTRESFALQFEQLHVKPATGFVLCRGCRHAPQQHIARSRTVHLGVISVEQYNQFLRERLDLADIQSNMPRCLIRSGTGGRTETARRIDKALQKQAASDSGKTSPESERALDKLLAKQNELNQKLNKQAERMEQFVRKDPVYDIESELQDNLKDLAPEFATRPTPMKRPAAALHRKFTCRRKTKSDARVGSTV